MSSVRRCAEPKNCRCLLPAQEVSHEQDNYDHRYIERPGKHVRVVLFGATGMVGKSVLRQCLLGRAMILVAAQAGPKRVLESADLVDLGRR